ncbi:hypothetical protein [Shumkonia mesophila]|uniref:hypothetical protein n=1 Tax=Shumkonia mesophila TaxID=2838854 RepID=UPI002934BFE7|nr:hypothetical protein [Shumkonia mesophila]
MKKLLTLCSLAVAIAAALLFNQLAPVDDARAATPNIAVATPGVQIVPIHLQGQFTADVTAVVRLKLPFPAKVLGVSASARASGGTTPTLTVDVLDDGTTILAAPIAVTAAAVAEGTLAAPTIADESVITVNLVITGTNPTWDDIDVVITLIRR